MVDCYCNNGQTFRDTRKQENIDSMVYGGTGLYSYSPSRTQTTDPLKVIPWNRTSAVRLSGTHVNPPGSGAAALNASLGRVLERNEYIIR